MRKSCFRLRGAIAVEEDQVRCEGFCAQLTEHRGYLAAMVSAVIHQVLQHLPERLSLRHASGRLVVHDSLHFFGRERRNVIQQVAFNFRPADAQGLKVWKFGIGGV